MANFNERSADAIAQKTKEILKDPALIEKAVKKEAASIISGRIAKRFFDDAYAISYSKADLARRPFLNIGPGSFRHSNWRTADKKYGDGSAAWTEMRRGVKQAPVDYYWDVYTGDQMSEEDSFFKVIYTSHVIEHLFPQDVTFLLSEAQRLLEPGGVLRIVCPDAEQIANAYRERDWVFFMNYLIAKTGRQSTPMSKMREPLLAELAAEFLIEWTSLLTHKGNPITLNRAQCVKFLAGYSDIFEAFDEASRLSSRELNQSAGGHVNWFSREKLKRLLHEAGFSRINESAYLKSSIPVLRDSRYFDRTDPEMSLFMEAIK
ncbi:class I SAM-dependent methyltransferase [Neorhizobium petrolearium]|uniref:Methyltransferase domain-containing protein n=1 Tax=Neorhizobium petrolearium TaxID=515361 RepID=A0ABY8M2A5_9HYPH|nr:methyltransferase domain-containing protein [Neorhizobium petrolearium]MCC2608402.1 methyltransferase domain-containing protein [Neorhizobium petrolearium]WGI68680.1 methyltransferase domain-containing protein [Neorhizobium petrolearium]